MTTLVDLEPVVEPPRPVADVPRRLSQRRPMADRVFRGGVRGGGLIVLAIMAMVGAFLLYRAWQALGIAGWSFLTTEAWEPDAGRFGIAAVLVGTVLIGLTAILIALPLAIGTALYISEYTSGRLQRFLVSMVDLMAAVPSVVYGLWGLFLLQPHILVVGDSGEGPPRWLATYFGWLPFLGLDNVDPRDPLTTGTTYTSSTFVAGVVVALMVTPIACSVMREVFSQAPPSEREGAYALGSTKWGMIRAVVLPYGRGGIIGGTMLGLGRALGETIAVYMIISPVFVIQPNILQNGASSVASLIALRYGDASAIGISALMAAGLALFVLTLIVNMVASAVVARSRSGAGAEA